MDNKNIKELGIWGIIWAGIVYLLSLPILIWKSSHLGKVIFTFAFLSVCINATVKAVDKGLDYYERFTGIQYRIAKRDEYRREYLRMNAALVGLNTRVLKNQSDLNNYDALIRTKVEGKALDLEKILADRLNVKEIDERILKINTAIELMTEESHKSVKQKIIEVKDLVKLHQESIDSIKIHTLLEQIADNINFLTGDEKQRMLKDLQEIGFDLKNLKKELDQTRFIAVTSDTVIPISYNH